jgi:hypothetical protein
MKRTDKIEKRIREFEVKTNAEKDKSVLDLLLSVQAKGEGGMRLYRVSWRTIARVGVISAAAGVVVVSAVWWFAVGGKDEISRQAGGGETAAARPQSPAEMTTLMSLNKAFYSGGMEAVEKQFNEVEKRVRPELKEHITIDQLLCESGYCKETLKEKTL